MLDGFVASHIRVLKEEIKDWVRGQIMEALGNFLFNTKIARAKDSNEEPLVHTAEKWGSSDGFTGSNAATGEIARPSAKSTECPGFAVGLRDGDDCVLLGRGGNLLLIPRASIRWRPKDIKQTETAMYNLAEAQGIIKINKDGAINITSTTNQKVKVDAGTGADVQINGGTAKVGRVGDKVNMGQLSLTMAMGVVTGVKWYSPDGGPGIPIAVDPAITPIYGRIQEGAERFKG
jgi:hypothetical protein